MYSNSNNSSTLKTAHKLSLHEHNLLTKFIDRQREWSRITFGSGPRTLGILDHITTEIEEIKADPTDVSEWIDIVILALDGAWRTGASTNDILCALVNKQHINIGRDWGDSIPSDDEMRGHNKGGSNSDER